jgi:HlyD family secretion protein
MKPGPARNPWLARGMRAATAVMLTGALSGCGKTAPRAFNGYVEGDYVRLSSPIGGMLTRVYLQRGQQADANVPAFVLERDSEQAAEQEARFRVEQAKAQRSDLEKGKRPDEIAAAQAQLAQAQAALGLARANLARNRQLVAQGFQSSATLDDLQAQVDANDNRVRELQAQLRLAQQGARRDAIAAAAEQVRAAEAQAAQAAWRVTQKAQRTPVAGAVADVLYREGEWVPPGSPVVALLPPGNVKARFFVPQAEANALRLGQRVVIRCDGCGAAIDGTVSYIAPEAEFTSPLIYSKENRAALVFMVEARPAPEQAARLHPGQPVEVSLAAAATGAP